jgi:branched-chain amino acid transport system permease protein
MMFKQLNLRGQLLIALGLSIVLLVLLPPIMPIYIVILLTQSLILAIVALSLDVLIGYTNLGSLGHGAFFGIGAYTTAILATKVGTGFGINLVASIGIAAAASAVCAFLFLRATGIYFLLITLAVAMSIWGLAMRWVSLTGGENGISHIPRPDLVIPWNLADNINYYYLVLIVFVICFVLIVLWVRSPFGRTLIGIRDSEERMKVLGYHVWLHKYLALIIAGAFAGVAGCLYAHFHEFTGPDNIGLAFCMELVLMVCIGGPGTLFGAIIGAFLLSFATHWISIYTGRWMLILGLIYIISAKYLPDGFMGLWKEFQKRREGV